jgi:hypothetical protein
MTTVFIRVPKGVGHAAESYDGSVGSAYRTLKRWRDGGRVRNNTPVYATYLDRDGDDEEAGVLLTWVGDLMAVLAMDAEARPRLGWAMAVPKGAPNFHLVRRLLTYDGPDGLSAVLEVARDLYRGLDELSLPTA